MPSGSLELASEYCHLQLSLTRGAFAHGDLTWLLLFLLPAWTLRL